ncbi:hypothetical protein J5N97_003132 [Dioscorea zingiberensis]|uniref:Prephenate/arogenate dehydrogenase domain-containing protein n=1 Tax=Dioscorea zingiberensis TaxID=325984 RepID=A0A9D5D432_9LILI|nr:hypothetical protein J5N97_003132 [Dioscorea zingiberensis]
MALCPYSSPSFLHLRHNRRNRSRPLVVRSLDAAQPFDLESQVSERLNSESKLKIAIVGFGNYGQFLARTFSAQGHTLIAHSRSDYSDAASALGASFYRDPDDLCEQHPDVVLLSTSILSAAQVLNSLPLGRLRRSTLFADVLSVKEFPRNLLLSTLPQDFDILCTHPMFGPESARHGWSGLPFVFEKVRIGESEERISRCNRFLEIFEKEGCRMVEMTCAEHDFKTAESQFLTHTIGRILARLGPEDMDIGTKGYQTLLELVQNTCNDSFDLYNGLFMYNKNATELLERLDFAFTELKKELFANLHDILRKQLFESSQQSNE